MASPALGDVTPEPGEAFTAEIGMEDEAGDDAPHDCVGHLHAVSGDGRADVMEDLTICDDHDHVPE